MALIQFPRLLTRTGFLISALSCAAFAGTVSPDLASSDSDDVVKVIVHQKGSSSSICGAKSVANLPGIKGELCAMTASEAKALAQSANAHVSLNHSIQGSAVPVYDYVPQTIHPRLSAGNAGSPNFNLGKHLGVAVIDSGINAASLDFISNNDDGNNRSHIVYAER